uniref:Ig-like domain-containing protein n=1 Tax=Denticeps clupeoides TaxID=299321 RepID=A0AAY4EVZ0_9TELE
MNLSMIAYFCLILNAVSGDASGILYVETNGGFLLLPHISGVKEDIFWKHNHNKMVEWNRMRPGISEYLQFQQRTQLNTETGDVTVTGVTTADRGLYEAEITVNRKIKRFTQQICNIFKLPPDPVRNTRISCDVTGSTVTLVCEADGPLLSYSWTGPGLQNPENRSQIQISQENLGSNYTCLVKNPVSEETQNYTAGDCSTRGEEPRASSDLYLPSFLISFVCVSKDRTIFLVGSVVGCLLLLLILRTKNH